jgi:uncharacterized membrane protein
MIRGLMILLVGLVLGAIVHLTTIILLPLTATRDAYARLTPIAPVNTMTVLPENAPSEALMPFMDPAFASAVCRYDLSNGPLKFTAPVSLAYTSVTFYTRRDIAYYAINDRAAGRRTIELELMTADQRAELPEDEEITAADQLIVESPTMTGLIALRALAPEPGLMPTVRATVGTARCAPEPQPRQPSR